MCNLTLQIGKISVKKIISPFFTQITTKFPLDYWWLIEIYRLQMRSIRKRGSSSGLIRESASRIFHERGLGPISRPFRYPSPWKWLRVMIQHSVSTANGCPDMHQATGKFKSRSKKARQDGSQSCSPYPLVLYVSTFASNFYIQPI